VGAMLEVLGDITEEWVAGTMAAGRPHKLAA
jgi:hypothetical protein